jgi:hypothetical protein
MKYLITLLFAISVTFISGCGGYQPLSGKVTFADDDSPLTTGMIVFDDGVHVARAAIQSDGTYVAGFDKADDGIPHGNYNVSISGAMEMLPNPQDVYPPPMRPLIDEKYTNKATSGLSITVDGKSNTFDIQVERPKKLSSGK